MANVGNIHFLGNLLKSTDRRHSPSAESAGKVLVSQNSGETDSREYFSAKVGLFMKLLPGLIGFIM